MPSKKSRPILYELVQRDKARDRAKRAVTAEGNGTGDTHPAKPATVSMPRRENVRFGRTSQNASSQPPVTRWMSRLGPTGIASIATGSLLAILLLAQAWMYLSRRGDSPGSRPPAEADSPARSIESPPGNNPRVSPSAARNTTPTIDPAPPSGSRAQLPPFAGLENRDPNRQTGSASGTGQDRNVNPPVDPRVQPRNETNPNIPRDQTSGSPPASPPSEPVQWDTTLQKGRHYVVVAHYKKSDLMLAQNAAAFLQERGIPCVIHEIRNAYMVVATQPFLINQKDAAARKAQQARADEFKRRIRALGKEHSRGSGNAFDQCYERLF
jgi:hypothetical protein